MRVILMHGKDTNPDEKWYPWFAKSIKEQGMDFVAPRLPKSEDPHIDEWVAELSKTHPDDNTILVGHSRGGMAILRWLEKAESAKVMKVILVATNSGFIKNRSLPEETSHGFYSIEGYDFKKIREKCKDFVVLHSSDDRWVPFADGEQNAAGLEATFLKFEDRGHFGKEGAIPELLKEIQILLPSKV